MHEWGEIVIKACFQYVTQKVSRCSPIYQMSHDSESYFLKS